MKIKTTLAALLPVLGPAVLQNALAAAPSAPEEQMVVTASPASDSTDAAAGAGFKTDEITVGPLGDKAWIDTPYSSTTVTKEMIENQQAQSVSELLKYSPSTQMQARGGMDVGRPQSRGMQGSVVANSRLDGLNVVSTTAFPVEMLERLDVLNSLTGALYGPASPAGQFNFVAKRPTEQTLRKVSVGYQGRGAVTGHADLGGHFDDQHRFGYRLNLLNQDGEGNVDGSTLRRKLAAVALDWDIQPGTQLQLDASHYEFLQKGYPGSFSYGPNVKLPSAPNPKNRNLALKTAGNDLTTDTISTHLIHYFNDDWSMNAGVGWQQADRAMRSVNSKIINNQGDMTRSMKDSTAAGRFRVLSNAVTLNGRLMTGSVSHDLALSTTGYVWSLYSAKRAGGSYSWGTSNIHDPSRMGEQGDGKIHTGGPRYRSSVNSQQSITVGDTATFNAQWSAMFFLSQSWLQTKNYAKHGGKTGETNEDGLSPNAALMYKITPNTLAYISYADSLEQGGTAPTDDSIKNAGQTLDPYRSKQYEIGLKSDIGGMNLGAALFRLRRPFAYVNADDVYQEQGKQVNNGLELTATGNLWQNLNLYSGVTFLDPKLKDTASSATRNQRVVGVPKVQANLLAEYSLPAMPELVYSANVHYTGRRAANDTNTSYASSYTTWDLGTRYTTRVSNVPTTLRLVVNNVFDKHYWASIFPSSTDGDNGSPSAFLGGGREVRASVTFDF